MADDFRARRSTRLARHHSFDALSLQAIRQHLNLGGFAGALAAFKRDEAAFLGFGCLGVSRHAYSFSMPDRSRPIASSLAPSKARLVIEPVPTDLPACTGTSSARLPLRHSLNVPTRWSFCTGAWIGPVSTIRAISLSVPFFC